MKKVNAFLQEDSHDSHFNRNWVNVDGEDSCNYVWITASKQMNNLYFTDKRWKVVSETLGHLKFAPCSPLRVMYHFPSSPTIPINQPKTLLTAEVHYVFYHSKVWREWIHSCSIIYVYTADGRIRTQCRAQYRVCDWGLSTRLPSVGLYSCNKRYVFRIQIGFNAMDILRVRFYTMLNL